jgi:hypothetical protein
MHRNLLGVFASLVTFTVFCAAARSEEAQQMTLVASDAAIK